MPAAYPAHREADVVLRDGSTVHVRPVRAGDRDALLDFFAGLSPDSRAFRFFTGAVNLEEIAQRAADVDYAERYGLVATSGPDAIAGHALYIREDSDRAEIAFAIADRLQGRGLGTILLAHLAEVAADHGLHTFEATVMPQNHRMVEVFRESGFPVDVRAEPGELRIDLPTSFSDEAVTRFEQRDRIAAVAAVTAFLRPASVAVIGASRQRGTVGGEVFHNLLSSGFDGPVYPVNFAAGVVQSVAAYPSVRAVPGPVELAVIAVPAAAVPDAARECAEKGVRAVIVLSAGFGETGPDGTQLQAELLDVCRGAGMRLIGPNCLGVLNTTSGARLNATFAPGSPPSGPVGFLSQSGALGLAMIDHAREAQIGLSSFASIGNRADISGNDLIEYWEEDAETSVILLYLESFGNPRRFGRLARRVARSKPILAMKSGRSRAGIRAAGSHTAALAGSEEAVDALFHQAGVIRADTLGQLLDVASLLATQPLPAGRSVAVVTNAGGLGILCADACEAAGLELPSLGDETREALARVLPAEASLANPVDLLGSATGAAYEAALPLVLADRHVDAVIVLFVPPVVAGADEVAAAISRAVDGLDDAGKPVLAVVMSGAGTPAALREGARAIAGFSYPESAAAALGRAAARADWLRRPAGTVPELDGVDAASARAAVSGALADADELWLPPPQVRALLEAYGLPLVSERYVASEREGLVAAADLGYPVVAKTALPGVHKSERGGVALDLRDERELSAALVAVGLPAVVQPMVRGGAELLAGVVQDPVFGPLVAFGPGGVLAEIIGDAQVRIAPLTDADAEELVLGGKAGRLVRGFRTQPSDAAALADVVHRLSRLAEELPEVAELDLNPVIGLPEGCVVVDARVRVATPRAPARSKTW